jgi:DNA repair protein RecO
MSIIKTEAFVLKTFNYGDTSKIATLFTKDHGKMNVIVKGVRNYKSKYCGMFNTMNYISAVIYVKETRDLQNVSSADHIKSFKNISSNLDKLNSAYTLMETLNKSSYENDSSPQLFELLLNDIEALDLSTKNFINFIIHFQVHLSRINGFLALNSSEINSETLKEKRLFNLDRKSEDIIKNFLTCEINEIENFFIDNDSANTLRNFLDSHIAENTDHRQIYKSKKVFEELN